jgi:hypothetical protein
MAMKINKLGNYTSRMLPNGDTLFVYPLTFGRARVSIADYLDFFMYRDSW